MELELNNTKQEQYTVQLFIKKYVRFSNHSKMTMMQLYTKFQEFSGIPAIAISSSPLIPTFLEFASSFGIFIRKVENPFGNWKIKRSNCWRVQIEEPEIKESPICSSIKIMNPIEEDRFFFERFIDSNGEEFIPDIPEESLDKSQCFNTDGEEIIPDIEESNLEKENNYTSPEQSNEDWALNVGDFQHNSENETLESETEMSINSEIMIHSEISESIQLPDSQKDSEISLHSIKHSCHGEVKFTDISEEEKVQALTFLGLDVVTLNHFVVHFVDYQPCACSHFLNAKDIDHYYRIGKQNTLIISLNTPPMKYLLVCAVIVNELEDKKDEFAKILSNIHRYNSRQRRGKKRKCKGAMYAYGYRSERLTSGYGTYKNPKPSKKKPITLQERLDYNSHLEEIVERYTIIFSKFLPLQYKEALALRAKYHAPVIGNSYAGNFTITHNFQSIPHTDPDISFAFGAWYNYGTEIIENGQFVFPDHKVAVEITHGVCIAWHSAFSKHATIACNPQKSTRIGTSIQLSRKLAFRALRLWKQHHS